MDPAQQPTVEHVGPTDFMVKLPLEIVYMIMPMLQLWQQVALRRVSRSWMARVEKWFLFINSKMPLYHSLKLNVKKIREIELNAEPLHAHPWQPNESIRRMQFDFVYKEPEIRPSNREQITLCGSAFNSDAAQVIGCIFPHIRELIIYWDTDDSQENVDSLVVLLSQFSSLTSFGLIVSGELANSTVLAQICSAINTPFGQLKQLYLMVSLVCQPTYPQLETYLHSFGNLDKAIKSVTSFNVTSLIGLRLFFDNLDSPLASHLDTLTIDCNGIGGCLLPVARPQLASVKRLQLLDISRREDVEELIELFPNVEQLHLAHLWRESTFDLNHPPKHPTTFGYNWIRVLKRFTKLTELTLYNFHLEFLSHAAANIENYFGGPLERFDQVRKLTVASPDLFYHFQLAKRRPFLPGLKAQHLGHTIGIRFPGLRELNLWSGDNNLSKTIDDSWQTIEQSINEQLPDILPLMPELRVNVQLRHPVMYREYVSWHVDVRQENRDNMTDFYAYTMRICNKLIEQNAGEYDDGYVVRLLNGHINNNEQDTQAVDRLTNLYSVQIGMNNFLHIYCRLAGLL